MYSEVAVSEESRGGAVEVWWGWMKKKKKNVLTCCWGGGLMRGLFTMKLGGIWVLTGFGVGRAILKKNRKKKIKKKLDKQRKV